jgi:hypothetical protein
MVNKIAGYGVHSAPTLDPIQLAWMVNQIDGFKPFKSFQSPSPSRQAGWGRTPFSAERP